MSPDTPCLPSLVELLKKDCQNVIFFKKKYVMIYNFFNMDLNMFILHRHLTDYKDLIENLHTCYVAGLEHLFGSTAEVNPKPNTHTTHYTCTLAHTLYWLTHSHTTHILPHILTTTLSHILLYIYTTHTLLLLLTHSHTLHTAPHALPTTHSCFVFC